MTDTSDSRLDLERAVNGNLNEQQKEIRIFKCVIVVENTVFLQIFGRERSNGILTS